MDKMETKIYVLFAIYSVFAISYVGCELSSGGALFNATLTRPKPLPMPLLKPQSSTAFLTSSFFDFQCDDGNRIPHSKFCNFVDDCKNGADEKNCGTTDFQEGTGGWDEWSEWGDKFMFKRAKGFQGHSPLQDHTYGNASGFYIFVEKGDYSNYTDEMISYLYSPFFNPPSSDDCEMNFAYFAYHDKIDVFICSVDSTDCLPAWETPITSEYKWQEATIHVGRDFTKLMKGRWYVEFEARSNKTLNSDLLQSVVALDDIQFVNCANFSEWWQHDGYLYKYVSNISSWSNARTICQQEGAELVMPKTKSTDDFIRSKWTDIWLGINDIEREGTFVYVDGSSVRTSFWASGEPNNQWDEDCVQYREDLDGWNDISCEANLSFVCQKGFAATPTRPQMTTPGIITTQSTHKPVTCAIAKDAKYISALLRTILLMVKLATPEALQNLFKRNVSQLSKAVNSAKHLFELIHTDATSEKPTLGGYNPLFEALDKLQKLDSSHSQQLLGETDQDLKMLLVLSSGMSAELIKEQTLKALNKALSQCLNIIKNGCI